VLACWGGRLRGERLLQAESNLYVNHQPAGGLPVNLVGENRPRHLADRALDGPEAPETYAGPREQLATLLLTPALGVQLPGVAVADGFAFHGRSFALLSVLAEPLAAPIVGVAGLRHEVDIRCFFAHPCPFPLPD
jgi:hypothetical protein